MGGCRRCHYHCHRREPPPTPPSLLPPLAGLPPPPLPSVGSRRQEGEGEEGSHIAATLSCSHRRYPLLWIWEGRKRRGEQNMGEVREGLCRLLRALSAPSLSGHAAVAAPPLRRREREREGEGPRMLPPPSPVPAVAWLSVIAGCGWRCHGVQ